MKKVVCALLLLAVLLALSSCGYNAEKEGTDKIGVAESENGIARLLPRNMKGVYDYNNFIDFDELFQSIDENAYYKLEDNFPISECELVLVYFKYSEDIFEDVKEYIMSDMEISTENYIFQNGKYTFYEMAESKSGFLSWKEMIFAFNDETQTIVLMGSYFEGFDWMKAKLNYPFFESPYFERYLWLYSDFYDFSK